MEIRKATLRDAKGNKMTKPNFKFLEHTADVKILVEETSLDEAFATSAMAMKQVIAEKVKVAPKTEKTIEKRAKDLGALLYTFLEEFLYLLDAEGFLLSEIREIRVKKVKPGYSLIARVSGDKASNYKFSNDVKAITYNDMLIKQTGKKFIIQFVLDV